MCPAAGDPCSPACARPCQQNNCSPVLPEQGEEEPLLGPVCSQGKVLHLELSHTRLNSVGGFICMKLHLSGLSCLMNEWHFPGCASSSGFSELSAAVLCLVCSVVDNTQIGTNSLSIQIGKFWTCRMGLLSPCTFSLGLATRVSWVGVGGCGGRGAFASRQGKL